jgi:hypothetical protein
MSAPSQPQSRKAIGGRPPVAQAAAKSQKLAHGPIITHWSPGDGGWFALEVDLRLKQRKELLAIKRDFGKFQVHLLRKADDLEEAIAKKEAELAELQQKKEKTEEIAAKADKDKKALEEFLTKPDNV